MLLIYIPLLFVFFNGFEFKYSIRMLKKMTFLFWNIKKQ